MIFFSTIFYYLIITVSILLTSFFFRQLSKKKTFCLESESRKLILAHLYFTKRLNNINKLFGLYGISVHFSPPRVKVITGSEFQVLYAFL